MRGKRGNLLQEIYYLVHSIGSKESIKTLLFFITILHKTQEIEIINNTHQETHSDMIALSALVKYCSVINAVTYDQVILIILGFFILHGIFGFLFCYSYFSEIRQSSICSFLHYFILYYNLIFYIPVAYSSLLFITQPDVCNHSNLCSQVNNVGLIIVCLVNLIIALMMISVQLYFTRAESLMGDNHVLILNFSFVSNLTIQVAMFATIVLRGIQMIQGLRFALILIKYLLILFRQINQTNCKIYILMDLITIITSISLITGLNLDEYLLILLLVVSLFYQLTDLIENHYVTTRDQENLITLQKIEQSTKLGASVQSKFILLIIKQIHNCNKCKYHQQITECILRKMANNPKQSSNQIITLYCVYISNHAPLKALIRLLLLNPENLYFKCASKHLSNELNDRSQQFQKGAQNKISVKNTGEHQNSLDVQTVYTTSHSAQELFPTIIDAIQGKITFWNKLINGYSDIDYCLNEALKCSGKMLKCKQQIEERFDLTYNKLLNAPYPDIISLRIIQIYYCGIYTNQFSAFAIEKTIDELLKSERYKQDETLDNVQLVQDRLIILKSSFVKKRGELISVNYKQLAKFLNEPEESVKMIKHCSQLMPSFLAYIHDQLMNNYLQNGYSKLMIHGESSFFQNICGYIEPCSINLFNFFDGEDDFILNMILTKEQSNSETILFGIEGKILGITSLFFEEAIKSNTTYTKSLQSTKIVEVSQVATISDFLAKQPLIQYYIPNIITQIEELRTQICQSQNYLMNNQRSNWIIPNNHSDCLASTSQLLQQFKKKSQGSVGNNFRSYKSQTYSKYSNYTNNTQQEQYDENEIGKDVLHQIAIDGIPIIILHPDLCDSIKGLIDQGGDNAKLTIQLGLFYSLQFKLLKYKKESYGYFMLNVKEYKFYTSVYQDKTQYQYSSHSQTPYTIKSRFTESQEPETMQNSFQMDIKSENPNQQSELIQEIKMMNNLILNLRENQQIDQSGNNLSLDQSNLKIQLQLKNSERSNLNETSRALVQNLPLFPKLQLMDEHQVELKEMEEDMQKIKQAFQDDFDENEQDLANQKLESNSQSAKKQSNILNKFKMTQQQQKQENVDFASNPSRTSTNSTSKESITIVQQLYCNTNVITPLKKISFLLGLVSIGTLICEIINIFQVKDNLEQQTQNVINLVKPQNIVYFYASVLSQYWGIELDELGILQLSEFQRQRNIETLPYMINYGNTNLHELNIDVPITAASLGINTYNMRFVENNKVQTVLYQLSNLYPIMYEITVQQFKDMAYSEHPNFYSLHTSGIIRQNFLQLCDLHNQLVIQISEDTISKQSEVKSYFLTVMLIELFSILLFVGFQLRYWLFMDHVTKSILFLVSRLNENQSLDQITKLTAIKEHLEDTTSNVWKLFNFGESIFEASDKKVKQKVVLKQQEMTANNFRSTSALYSRIQKTQYLNRINAFITFLITILWIAFLLTGYLIHMQKNDNFQPSLTATLKYGQFRLNMDALSFIAYIVKTENLVPSNNMSFINETYALSLFFEFKNNLSPLINQVAQVILENANANNKQSRFDNILNYDICAFTAWEDMKACDVTRYNLPYKSKDSINDIVSNGILGYTAAYVKYLSSDFDFEQQAMVYDSVEDNKISIQSKPFQNFQLSYFCDIQNTFLEFLNLFQIDNAEIAADINNVISIFYLGVGICLFIFLCSLSIIWVYKSQKTITCLRQILVLLPQDLILTANIRSQAKEIHNWLY